MRVPMKGKPDFHSVSDSKLKLYLEVAQQMIFTYNEFEDKKALMKEVWKDISDELVDRIPSDFEGDEVVTNTTIMKPKKVVKRSPVKKLH